ncbi:hypothetical protein [Hymenobacter lucidus]|uniref:DUF4136 domain-containing protein n=1 Tax=Hymenobacter lucidus TaxID=2880930 RepID=A0ABS8AWC8_9BACT|nr:hypothetical protein [Hymenobacter lucidus]MCB2410103.1 hypothetical protein [Hymenobacter lucidus]
MRQPAGYLFFALLLFGSCQQDKPATAGPGAATATPGAKGREFRRPAKAYYLDTTYAIALYQGRNDFRPFAQTEEYQEFELQHDSVVALLHTLYGTEPGFSSNLARLEQNRGKFLVNTRQSVLSDYRKFHMIDSKDFDFLLAREDSIVKPLLLRVLADDSSNADNKEYARKTLLTYYNIRPKR